jgi:tRNA threonylcarbamoyladenosine biosynthesis protein TsaE
MIIGLQGSLGAGKTTFTRGFARGLNISEPVTSPTYTLIRQYEGRLPFYHMDLYRIGDEEEFYLLGADEMIYGKGICLIEWYERVINLLPRDMIHIKITINEDQSRTIAIEGWEILLIFLPVVAVLVQQNLLKRVICVN